MPLPTVLIAGAQRCGTSTLTSYLRRHPRIFMAKPKELHFFDMHYDKGMDWYAEFFTPKERHIVLGEATPIYMFDPVARERIAHHLPDIKLIVSLRDPTKRAYSQFFHAKRNDKEDLESFEEALDLEPARLSSGQSQSLCPPLLCQTRRVHRPAGGTGGPVRP